MKRLNFFYIFSLLCALVISSCSKDDDGGNSGGGYSGYVKSITAEIEGYKCVFTYTYDSEGRVVKCVMTEEEEGDEDYYDTFEYSYSGNQIIVGGTYFEEAATITLNDDMTINSISFDDYWSVSNYVYTDGRVTSFQEESRTYYVTWSDGNAVNDAGDEFVYSSYDNSANVDFNAIFSCLGDGTYLGDSYMLSPLKGYVKGVWSDKLVSSVYDETYDYEITNGRVTKVFFDYSDEEPYEAVVAYY